MIHANDIVSRSLSIVLCILSVITLCVSCSNDDSANDGIRIPAILGFSPESGEPGDEITIVGTDLLNATEVSFNGITSTISDNKLRSLTTIVPEGGTTGKLSITTEGGIAISVESFEVVVLGAAQVTDITPKSAQVGQEIILTGTAMATVNKVTVGGIDGTIINTSETEVVFTLGASPIGLSAIQLTSEGGVSSTDVNSNEFYVVEVMTPYFETFDEATVLFSSGGDAEISNLGVSDILPSDATLVPNPIDNNFYYIGGTSDTGDSGSYTGQIGHSRESSGFFADFFNEDSRELTQLYFNIQINFQGIPNDYSGPLAGFRLRFDEGYDADGDGSTTDEYVEFRPSLQNLEDLGYIPNDDGWYTLSISFDQFVNSGPSGGTGTWSVYAVETLTRFAIASRREHDGEYSLSIDNIYITKGGPLHVR
ncbi:IPT/TIG domain-containing protein [uncultured Aquimarina sp.]|uniref:IPT/TIG domain-containing protein n=1 Tax=uncultured Aquimarina sp. TaxID=575652 RepID=UPI0026237AFE|nr:IPT/TIG domain-containing protein [uncultured Aquimarina sp.]